MTRTEAFDLLRRLTAPLTAEIAREEASDLLEVFQELQTELSEAEEARDTGPNGEEIASQRILDFENGWAACLATFIDQKLPDLAGMWDDHFRVREAWARCRHEVVSHKFAPPGPHALNGDADCYLPFSPYDLGLRGKELLLGSLPSQHSPEKRLPALPPDWCAQVNRPKPRRKR